MAVETSPVTPISADCQGKINSGKPEDLHAQAKDAIKKNDDTKAAHFFTMALDVLAKALKKDSNGRASDKDLQALNKTCEGLLAELLSGRSHVYLRQKDIDAAVEDAETCVRADPSYEKGHLRLAVAYEAAGVGLAQQLEAVEKAVDSCSHSEVLVKRKWRLKKAISEQSVGCAGYNRTQVPNADHNNNSESECGIEQTRKVADDVSHPSRALAAVDLGRSYAAGAHGLQKDLQEAAKYLRIGVQKGGDVSAQRDLGFVLLDMGVPAEAAEHLRAAADAGDEDAAAALQQLNKEAQERMEEAREKLKKLAAAGDPRALTMLKEFEGV